MADVAASSVTANGGIAYRDPTTGRAMAILAEPERIAAAEAACEQILMGRTLPQIAADYGVARTTLVVWLSQLPGDRYQRIRQIWIDAMLAESISEIDSEDSLSPAYLARAREKAKIAMWMAERRDPARYASAARVDVTSNQPVAPQFHVHIHDGRAREDVGQVIEGEIPTRDGE